MKRLTIMALPGVLVLAGCLSLPRQAPAPAGTDASPAASVPSYVVFGQRYYPMADAAGYRDRGVASWYGGKFHGRDTANGERYDMHGMTAAHKTLPLPTWVRVTNLRNGASIVVKVNDRGPFVKNRLIDLSYEAARRIDMIGEGTTLVEIEAIAPPAAVTATTVATAGDQAYRPDPGPGVSERTEADVIESLAYEPAAAAARVAAAGEQAYRPDPGMSASERAQADVTESLAYQPAAATAPAAGSLPAPAETAVTAQDAQPGAARVFVQVGAFGDFANAQRLREALYNAAVNNVRLANAESNGLPIYRVQIGPLVNVDEYDMLIARLETLGISETHLITD